MTNFCIAFECKNAAPSWTVENAHTSAENLLCPEHWVNLPYHPFRSFVRTIVQRRARYAGGHSDARFWMEVAILRARIALYEKKWTPRQAGENLHSSLLVLLPSLPLAYRHTLRRRFPSLVRLLPDSFTRTYTRYPAKKQPRKRETA